MSTVRWKDAPTRTVDVGGVEFAYRDLGTASDVPEDGPGQAHLAGSSRAGEGDPSCRSEPDDLSRITQPVFVANGDHDLMVASSHSADMARRLPNARLTIYSDSSHRGVFQHHEEFVPAALAFLNGSGEAPR